MRPCSQRFAVALGVLLLSFLSAVAAFGAGKSVTVTGEVGDAMCGNKHQMEGSPATCTRECISHGSKYALVVGDKVYTLETSDKAVLDKLNDLAGEKATVTGTGDDASIQVASVKAAK